MASKNIFNTQDLVSLGSLLRAGKNAAAYRLVESTEMSPSNADNINGVASNFGVSYSYGPHEDGRKYWKASYNRDSYYNVEGAAK